MYYVKTEKEDGRTVINLYGKISTYVFYNYFMKELYNYINTNVQRKQPPIISIKNVKWIDSNVLPCLIIMGIILKQYYRSPIRLEMVYRPSLLQYLEVTDFFYWVGEKRLNIFQFDKELIGGFNIFVKPYNRQYKIERFQSIPGFYEKDEEGRKLIKYSLLEQLERFDVKRIFGEVLSKVIEKDSQEYDRCIQAIAEVVCNSMLYSMSDSYICVQALPEAVHISICDMGIGFEESLKRKGMELDKNMYIDDSRINRIFKYTILNDFFAVFMALKYAEETDRVNLWKLKKIVTSNKGIMKIHSNRVQIIFSYTRCARCRRNSVDDCMKCMLENFTTNYRFSPLRIYEAKIEGVHIEIDFKRGEKHDSDIY